MSKQSEWSLNNFLGEVRELKERMEKVFPSYLVSLEKTSQLPSEFERRWWSSRVEALLEKVRADYQKYQARAKKADFLSKFMALGIDAVLKAGRMEPLPLPVSLQVGISISLLGKIEPALIDDLNRQPDAIIVTFGRFEAIIQRLRGELLKGMIVPKSEDEIPKLIYGLAVEQK
ncbi:MAG: hypothetical protein KAX31_05815 [Thermoplasmata archaeon]|nr:hypothetical protein [Thermoplasmata archaeon]